mgnify:CR=1 FL=1
MSKRVSGPPRRPRNPIAKNVRTPLYRQRVERDRKRHPMPPSRRDLEQDLDQTPDAGEEGAEKDAEK